MPKNDHGQLPKNIIVTFIIFIVRPLVYFYKCKFYSAQLYSILHKNRPPLANKIKTDKIELC